MSSLGAILTADEAARRLGVKRATLYTYVSRGWLRSLPGDDGDRRYLAAEVEELKRRADAHKGHGAAAAGALAWGPPVVDSAITSIDRDGPNYRGVPALQLAEDGVPFERVAELLWTGDVGAVDPKARPGKPETSRPEVDVVWEDVDPPFLDDVVPKDASPLARLGVAGAVLAARTGDDGLPGARRLVTSLARTLGGPAGSVSASLAVAGGVPQAQSDIEAVLALVADHELNVSAFTARIAASAGATLPACVAAALATMSGHRHGAMSERLEALLDGDDGHQDIAATIADLARRGEILPGFGHPLYPDGDPRAEALLDRVRGRPGTEDVFRMIDVAAEHGHPPPNLDVGLVAVGRAWNLPRGFLAAVFAVGRSAGWVAHVLEQRQSPSLLRPRARYVGT